MIRTLFSLLPPGSRTLVVAHLALTVVGVVLRAAGVVVLVPLVGRCSVPIPATRGRGWVSSRC